jgi:hypothetical protein
VMGKKPRKRVGQGLPVQGKAARARAERAAKLKAGRESRARGALAFALIILCTH